MKNRLLSELKVRRMKSRLDALRARCEVLNKQVNENLKTIASLNRVLTEPANDHFIINDDPFISPRFSLSNGPRKILKSVKDSKD